MKPQTAQQILELLREQQQQRQQEWDQWIQTPEAVLDIVADPDRGQRPGTPNEQSVAAIQTVLDQIRKARS